MSNLTKKAGLIFDITGQLAILVVPFIMKESFFITLFLGGAWQVVSNLNYTSDWNDKQWGRGLYWSCVRVMFIILFVTGGIAVLSMAGLYIFWLIVLLGLCIAFVGGAALYIMYLVISVRQLVLLIKKDTSMKFCHE